MILLLEGADVAGKTTLGDLLEKTYKGQGREVWRVHHSNKNNSIAQFTTSIMTAAAVRDRGGLAIIDRLWISEMVYGPIMRNHTNDPGGVVMQLAHVVGVITIMCVRADFTKHVRHFREVAKTRDEYAAAKIERIIERYHNLWYGGQGNRVVATDLHSCLGNSIPFRFLRSYYQYDMDHYTPEQFVNWILRLESQP